MIFRPEGLSPRAEARLGHASALGGLDVPSDEAELCGPRGCPGAERGSEGKRSVVWVSCQLARVPLHGRHPGKLAAYPTILRTDPATGPPYGGRGVGTHEVRVPGGKG